MIAGDEWLEATKVSFQGMVDAYFDVDAMPKEEFGDDKSSKVGAMIGLVSESNSVQIMLLASDRGSEILAKALLGFEPDEKIETVDLADALAEIVNIVGGMVKTEVNTQDNGLNLTLPTFMTGSCEPLGGLIVTDTRIHIGPVEAKLLIICQRQHQARVPRMKVAAG